MVGRGGSSADSYLTDPTSPIPSHCASIVVTSTLRVNTVNHGHEFRFDHSLFVKYVNLCLSHVLKANWGTSATTWMLVCAAKTPRTPLPTWPVYLVVWGIISRCMSTRPACVHWKEDTVPQTRHRALVGNQTSIFNLLNLNLILIH